MAKSWTLLAPDLATFEALLLKLPWFQRLGQPHPRDADVRRIDAWEKWPGPERGFGDWFGRYPAVVLEFIEDEYRDRWPELEALFERVERQVIDLGMACVPTASEGDAHHGPTACVYNAGYTVGLLALHVHLQRDVPEPLLAEWYWFNEGHWPCDYADEPPGYWDEGLIDVPAGKLVVY